MSDKKKVWIMNHYATTMYNEEGGRHYWLAQQLIRKGYQVTIICANTMHSTSDEIVVEDSKYLLRKKEDINFVFVKTTSYQNNGLSRVKNMFVFAVNSCKVAKKISREIGQPDIIYASSVHPLTLVAGLEIAKKFKVPCICEARDLWPEAIVEYGRVKANSLVAKVLYRGERWIYTKADALIFTMAGGKDYIVEKKWQKYIDLAKIYYINNGVDIRQFDKNANEFIWEDEDLSNQNIVKIVYTGSIRRVNNLEIIIDLADQIKEYSKIKFLIWGDGDQVDELKNMVKQRQLTNIVFKGKVAKKYVPSIVTRSDINMIHWQTSELLKYGCSYNKLFEYLAAGKPIFSTVHVGHSIVDDFQCGLESKDQSVLNLAETIIQLYNMSKEEKKRMGDNARSAACEYDFEVLAGKLSELIEHL